MGWRSRLTDHRVPRAARYAARGVCPDCRQKSLKRSDDWIACGACGWSYRLDVMDARIKGEARVAKTEPGAPIRVTRVPHPYEPPKKRKADRR